MIDYIGQQLGNYRIIRQIGSGGFAKVYLGQHVRLASQQAAIKILAMHLTPDDGQTFEREANTIASLTHPHIIRILDFDALNGLPFLVMDYAPNGSLRQRHRDKKSVPLPTVLSYVEQVASALQYAHEKRLIHRDIKPDNMLIDAHNQILLSDFGIATVAHNTTSQSAQAASGTVAYMAPEQFQEHPRPASDQYALAVTVYEWLAGERPFDGTFTEIAVKHAMTPPPSLIAKNPDLPRAVEHVVFTALSKDPKARFASVQEFATALEVASQEPTIPARVEVSHPIQLPETLRKVAVPTPNNDVSVTPQEALAPAISVTHPAPTTPVPLSDPLTGSSIREKGKPVRTRHISRRTALIGLVGLGATLAGGSAIASLVEHATIPPPGQLLYTYRGHLNVVESVAWSPNGERIVSGSADQTVQVWNASDGSNPFIYRGHSQPINAVAWSPNSQRIASASADSTVQVWDPLSGSNVFAYSGHNYQIFTVAWSPDGQRIASAGVDRTLQIWDAINANHPFIYRGYTNIIRSVCWSPESHRIACGGDNNTVQIIGAG